MVGIVDYIQKDQRSSYMSGNAMCYYGQDGSRYPNDGPRTENYKHGYRTLGEPTLVKEGDGFRQGDIVEV